MGKIFEKLRSWSLTSLNLQYYSLSLLSYNHSQVIHSLTKKLLWSCFFGKIFQPVIKEAAKSLRCFIPQHSTYALLQNDNFIRITFVRRLLSRGWQYSHANDNKTVTAKEDVKQKFSCCDII